MLPTGPTWILRIPASEVSEVDCGKCWPTKIPQNVVRVVTAYVWVQKNCSS